MIYNIVDYQIDYDNSIKVKNIIKIFGRRKLTKFNTLYILRNNCTDDEIGGNFFNLFNHYIR